MQKGWEKLNLFYLRYFVKLAHVKHYRKAAEEFFITQPSLSHAIMQLESELGVPLFEKSGRNTELTRFGKEFLVCAEKTLATLDEGIASLQKSAKGEGLIRLGFLRTLGVEYIPDMAARFLKENEGRDIRFTFHTGITSELIEGLKEMKYDLVFCSRPLEETGLNAVPVRKQKMVVITPQDHPLAEKEKVSLEELLPYPFIGFSRSSGLRSVVDQMFEKAGGHPLTVAETEEDQVVAGLTAQGFGVSVVPFMDLLKRLSVKILEIEFPENDRYFYMISDGRAFLPPAAQRFREFVMDDDHDL